MSRDARLYSVSRTFVFSLLAGFLFVGVVRSARTARAANPTPPTPLTYDAPPASGDRNRLKLHLEGDSLELLDSSSGAVLTTRSSAVTSSIIINGSVSDDTLLVDFSNGNPIPPGGLTFNGGNQVTRQGDLIEIEGGIFHTAVYNYFNAHDGTVVLDGSTINYTGLEPLSNSGTAANVIFNLPAGTVGASLQDDGTAGNNVVQLVSTNATFETTTFTVPTGSLTVNGGGGTDTIVTSANFAGDFNATLTINGTAATDIVTLNGLTLGTAGNTGNLSVLAHNINLNGDINTTAGTTGNVSFNGAVALAANETFNAKGDVSFSQTLNGAFNLIVNTPGGTNFFGIVGGLTPLTGINTDAAGLTRVAANVTTTGNQTYGDQLALFANLTLTSSGGGTLSFANIDNNFALTVSTGGTAIFNNPVGSLVALASLTVTANAMTQVTGAFTMTNLALSVNTGIGSPGTPLATQVSKVEASAMTGGIFITNTGALTIGGVTASLSGLTVTTSGDIQVIASGSIALSDTDGLQIVTGGNTSGNITLTANGATADVTDTVDHDAIIAPRGNITVVAGRDILLGTAGMDFDNDVRANNNIAFTAGRDVTVDGFSDVASDDFGNNTGGGVTGTAGRNINVTNTFGTDASLGASGNGAGNVTLTTGANSFFNLTAPFSNAVFSNSGNVTVNADRAAISNSSGITALNGIVTIQQVSTNFTINLGSATDAAVNTLELSDAELDRIFSPTLRIGNSGGTFIGGINVTAAITQAGSSYTTLSLRGGNGNIDETGAGTLTETNLAAQAGFVSLTQATNNVTNLAGTTSAFVQFGFQFTNSGNLNVGTVDGVVGISGTNPLFGDVLLNGGAGAVLTVSQPITTSNGRIALTFDDMIINNNVTAPALGLFGPALEGLVTLTPTFIGRPINLGMDVGGQLGLTNLELTRITAGTLLGIGNTADVGGIFVSAPIVAPGTWSSLDLRNSGAPAGFVGAGGLLTVPNLSFTDGFPGGRIFNLNNATSGPDAIEQVPNPPIPYVGTINLTINAGAGSDTFLVTPSLLGLTTFHINGNAPVTAPGDSLIVDTTGATGTLLTRSNPGGQTHDGNYTFTNRQPIFFTSIETLNPITNPTATNGTVSGRILDQDGHPVEGVGIWMSGTQSRLTVTDANGYFHFDDVQENGLYSLTPARLNYVFSPQTRQFSQLGQHTDAAFTAVYNGQSNNPLDRTEYFVRQQYVDFLGREPDEPGFTAWVNGINNCAPDDTSCDRVHVSEMFFRSAEFQQRGYFLYRFYSTAFGRKPDFVEFTPDMARVSGFLTEEQLEAAKIKFVDDFTTRPLFVSAYGGLSNADYVDALLHSAQVSLGNRDELVASLNSSTLTRAQVFRQIAESSEVYQKYYNQAFVVMEYFGYLRRDPDALYLEWIDVLNQTGDARHMVEGFVNSVEYRNRFTR